MWPAARSGCDVPQPSPKTEKPPSGGLSCEVDSTHTGWGPMWPATRSGCDAAPAVAKNRKAAFRRPFVRCPAVPGPGDSALARLETRVRLADHEDLATTADHLAVAVTGLRRLQGGQDLHDRPRQNWMDGTKPRILAGIFAPDQVVCCGRSWPATPATRAVRWPRCDRLKTPSASIPPASRSKRSSSGCSHSSSRTDPFHPGPPGNPPNPPARASRASRQRST